MTGVVRRALVWLRLSSIQGPMIDANGHIHCRGTSMNKRVIAVSLFIASAGFSLPTIGGDCVVHYERIACKGQEAESFKKCDGQPGCDKTKPANSEQECAAAALKSCDNDRLDITKYKAITATYDGKALVGGYDAAGNPDPVGPNFCAGDRPDMNKCE